MTASTSLFSSMPELPDSERHKLFVEAVQCLCGTLRLGKAIDDFFTFLCQHVPLSQLILGYGPPKHEHASVRLAYCDEKGVDVETLCLPYNPMQIKLRQETTFRPFADREEGVYVTDKRHPIALFFLNDFKPPFFFLRLHTDESLIGSGIFVCRRGSHFSQRHLAIMRTMRIPLLLAINNCLQYKQAEQVKNLALDDNMRLQQQLSGATTVEIIGAGSGLSGTMEKISLAAPVDVPVLISGETGSGKEVMARVLHDLSPRRGQAFVPVNCGAIPASLIDSELFGHVKGAFTGAINDHKGRFERANGGTLFLDEIGELPLEVQARLLRVLQDRAIERVGASEFIHVDFRLVAATHRNLHEMVAKGTFREDLYYRLSVMTVHLPPLRERRNDIHLLVPHLIRKLASQYGLTPPELAPDEMDKLLLYDWPGNVRELTNVLEEALVLNRNSPLRFPNFPPHPLNREKIPVPLGSLEDVQKEYFVSLLHSCGGRISGPHGAAVQAGLKESTFRYKLDKMGIAYRKS